MSNYNIDEQLNNADWVKQSWDLPKTLNGFQNIGDDDSKLKVTLYELFMLPVSRVMPESLKDEIRNKFGADFIPKFLNKNVSDKEGKAISGAIPLKPSSETEIIPRNKRTMRTRRLIKHKLPSQDLKK